MSRLGNAVGMGLVAALLFSHGLAFSGEWGVEALMQELGKRGSGRASFTERKHVALLDKPIEQSGTLAFSPGRLEKFTRAPYLERMVVDGDFLMIESGSERRRRRLRLQRYPAIWGFIEGLRATLNGDLTTLRQFYEIELSGSAADWQLLMTPRPGEMAAVVNRISIRGVRGQVGFIEVLQQGGDRSVMHIVESAT